MKGLWSVYRKELYILFASPIFYALALTFLIIAGYFFYNSVAYYNLLSFQASQNPMLADQLNLGQMVLRPFFLDLGIVLLLVSPLITMRLYAEERKTGTIELLFTYPLTDGATLLAKFYAVLTALAFLLVGTIPGMLVLDQITGINWSLVFSGYLGVLLLGGAFLSVGVFTSSLTQNQIIAGVISFGALLMFWIIGWARTMVGPEAAAVIGYLSITQHLDNFAKGVLDSRDVIYYVLFVTFFLFLTLRQMASYRWKG